MAAAHYQLDHLVGILDNNNLQISGEVDKVMRTASLAEKYASFGWAVREVDGHDLAALNAALESAPWEPGRPSLVLAHTIKGRGASFMENKAGWHHKTPTQEELALAMDELERAAEES
jgi:transketolase